MIVWSSITQSVPANGSLFELLVDLRKKFRVDGSSGRVRNRYLSNAIWNAYALAGLVELAGGPDLKGANATVPQKKRRDSEQQLQLNLASDEHE